MSGQLRLGRYRHFKGNEYEVLGVAMHSETEEKLVVYRQLYGSGDMWVRPISMWNETVEVDGVSKPRFEFIGDNDLHSGAAIPVEQAFDGVPRGEAFIRYCQLIGIRTIGELRPCHFDFRAVRGVGQTSMKRIHEVYSMLIGNLNMVADLEIAELNHRIAIEDLAYLGVERSLIDMLIALGYETVGDLDKVDRSTLATDVCETLTLLSRPVSVLFEEHMEALNDTGRTCLMRKSRGETLQSIADDVGLTRERVRQLIARARQIMRPWANLIASVMLSPDKTGFYQRELEELFENGQVAECCAFVLGDADVVEYLDFAARYVDKRKCPPDMDALLRRFVLDVIGDGMNFYDNIDQIEEQLRSYGLGVLRVEDLMHYLVYMGYHFFGEFVSRKKASNALACHDAITKYFPEGIKLDSNPDNADMARLREIMNVRYQGVQLPENNHALMARVTPHLILCARGRYCSFEHVKYDPALFKEIFAYIQQNERKSLYYGEIFAVFEEKLKKTSSVNNSHFLHGMLKHLYPSEFRYERDILVKPDSPREVIEDRICELIRQKGGPVRKDEIKEFVPGTADMVILFAVVREPKLMQWAYNEYNHVDNISFTEKDVVQMRCILEAVSEPFSGYASDVLLYDAVSVLMPAFIERNRIENETNLFYVAALMLGKEYKFSRPHIISPHFPVQDPSAASIACALLDTKNGIDYQAYMALAKRLKWSGGTVYTVFSEIEKGCFRVSRTQYVEKGEFTLSGKAKKAVADRLTKLVSQEGYYPLYKLDQDTEFPALKYPWNGFLAISILETYDLGFRVITPEVRDRRYLRGAVVPVGSPLKTLADLAVQQMKKDGVKSMSRIQMEKFFKDRSLIMNSLPEEIYGNSGLVYRDEQFYLK